MLSFEKNVFCDHSIRVIDCSIRVADCTVLLCCPVKVCVCLCECVSVYVCLCVCVCGEGDVSSNTQSTDTTCSLGSEVVRDYVLFTSDGSQLQLEH